MLNSTVVNPLNILTSIPGAKVGKLDVKPSIVKRPPIGELSGR